MPKINPLIAALDLEKKDCAAMVKKLFPAIEIFKIGGRLFTESGPDIVRMIQKKGKRVFLDLKFHDIPQTVAESVRMATRLGVWGMTLHTCGGKRMMMAASAAAKEEARKKKITPPILFGVTVLTSMDDGDLKSVGVIKKPKDQVVHLAKLAESSGLGGVVASAQEITLLRKALSSRMKILTPGLRLMQEEQQDQRRVATPQAAWQDGANFLVMGRTLLSAADPQKTAQEILRSLK